ncbi:hypothetical protein ACIREE_42395 [Streptomyces sp. NPDC102467]|uniref:hypothetical protein n=1 Tax=Streptomyces sp. NPDC102467 TaxID=3366179 RepID=UPI003811EFE1
MSLCILAAAALPLTGACSADHADSESKAKSLPHASSPASPSASPVEGDQTPVKVPPELDPGEKLAGRQGATHGGRTIAFAKGGRKGDALIVAVRCEGKGTMKVAVKPVTAAFPLECLAGEVSTTYNQLGLSGVEKEGTVSVTAPSTVNWSMTIARGEPPEGED